jgi:threonine dehydrogenase-like Zn-dependent dehydrogenase
MNRNAMPRFTEYAVANVNMVFKIPGNVRDIAPYCLAEPCASAMQGIDLAEIRIGNTVAISGTGGIGLILLNMLLLHGGTRVTVIEPVEGKRKLALAMGAEHAIDPFREDVLARCREITDGRGFDVVFEASGSPKAAPILLDLIGNKGKAVYFAVYPMEYELPVNLYKLYMKEGRIQTVFTSIYNFPRVMDLIPRLQMEKIIGTVMPLDQAVEAFALFHESIHPKILLKCSK